MTPDKRVEEIEDIIDDYYNIIDKNGGNYSTFDKDEVTRWLRFVLTDYGKFCELRGYEKGNNDALRTLPVYVSNNIKYDKKS